MPEARINFGVYFSYHLRGFFTSNVTLYELINLHILRTAAVFLALGAFMAALTGSPLSPIF